MLLAAPGLGGSKAPRAPLAASVVGFDLPSEVLPLRRERVGYKRLFRKRYFPVSSLSGREEGKNLSNLCLTWGFQTHYKPLT